MYPWWSNIFDNASDLAGSPDNGPVKTWLYGIGVALLLIAVGAYCAMTGHAWFLNIGFRGVPKQQPGLFCEVFGRQAIALGCVLIGLGLFAHVHWFWSNRPTLSRYAELGKVGALLGLIVSLGWWIFETMR